MKITKRPWGNFKEFAKNKKCTVKIIEVKPRQTLSLQVHKKRSESWYFFDKALVQIGDKAEKVKPGDIVKIEKGKMHRVMAGWRKVRFLEIAYGKFSEKDEKRLYDDYGRK
ncbi:MAG: phosphomannose isomerase type II C-terminal cupin domain [Nanoarchaeota archaeon]